MKLISLYFLAPAVLLFTSFTAQGQLFTEDFEDLTAGNTFTDGLGPSGDVQGSTGDQQTASNTGTPFGSGNIYADFHDTDPVNNYSSAQSSNYAVGNAVSTFQFDFHETSTGGGDNIVFGYAMQSDQLNSGGHRARLYLDDGVIENLTTTSSNTYSLDTSYTLYMILNDTASAVSYGGGTIAAGSADVWFEDFGGGNLTFAGSVDVANTQTASYRVAFRTFSSWEQQIYVDNVSLSEGAAAVPEPSTFTLLLGGLGLLALSRRRRA